jgi:hypothetical protein
LRATKQLSTFFSTSLLLENRWKAWNWPSIIMRMAVCSRKQRKTNALHTWLLNYHTYIHTYIHNIRHVCIIHTCMHYTYMYAFIFLQKMAQSQTHMHKHTYICIMSTTCALQKNKTSHTKKRNVIGHQEKLDSLYA